MQFEPRNVIAGIAGIIVSFMASGIIIFLLLNFSASFRQFALGGFKDGEFITILDRLNLVFIFFIFPLEAMITGLVVGFIAKSKEFLVAAISVLPLYLVFFTFTVHSFSEFVSIYTAVMVGTYIAKKIKLYKSNVKRRTGPIHD